MWWDKNKRETAVGNESSGKEKQESVTPPQGETSDQQVQVSDDKPSVKEPTTVEGSLGGNNAPTAIEATVDQADVGDKAGNAAASAAEEPNSGVPVGPPVTLLKHPVTRLPNCKITGIDYEHPLAAALASSFQPHEIKSVGITNKADGVNWAFNEQSHVISCKPTAAGEFEVELCVDVQKHERHVFPLRLTVNPDPKTLWKNLPSPKNGVYAKPDCDKAFLSCGDLSIVAASQRGRSHAQEAKPRDDDFAYNYDPDNARAVLVVADGAGYAKFSRKGSKIAVDTACEQVAHSTGKDYWAEMEPHIRKWKETQDSVSEKTIQKSLYTVLIHAAFEAKKKIDQEAKEHEARYKADYNKAEKFSAKDYATTLILTLAKKFDFGWFIATYWVGDGGVGIYQPNLNKVILHGIPDSGEYGGQTCFLTMDSVWPNDANVLIQRRIRFDVVDSFKAIILMTDGVTDPKFETENNLNSIIRWDDLWADLAKAVPWEKRDGSVADSLLAWMDFWSSGNHDDRTMMVLY